MQNCDEEFVVAGRLMETGLVGADVSRNALAAQIVRSFGRLRVRVVGPSMLPALRPDDLLLIRRCDPEEATPGDIVVFNRHQMLVAHRVVARCGAHIVTQGDGVLDPDNPPVTASELLGKVISATRRGKPVGTGSNMTFGGRMATVILRRSTVARRIFTRLHSVQNRALS